MGDLLQKQNNLADALASYRAALAIDEERLTAKPDAIATLEDIRSSHYSIGQILRRQGDLASALAGFQAGLAANERLATIDSGNSDRQRAIWESHTTIGEVFQDQGLLADALVHYTAAQNIAEGRSKADPINPTWQINLATSYSKVAGLQFAKDDRSDALAVWRKALAIVEASAVTVEQDETKTAGKPGTKTAGALGVVAWHALFARDARKAFAASERSRTLAPELLWTETNRAHALLLLGRAREARALYVMHKGKVTANGPWEQVIADDFRTLRRAGLARPMMHEVEVALGIAPPQAGQSSNAGAHRAAKP